MQEDDEVPDASPVAAGASIQERLVQAMEEASVIGQPGASLCEVTASCNLGKFIAERYNKDDMSRRKFVKVCVAFCWAVSVRLWWTSLQLRQWQNG